MIAALGSVFGAVLEWCNKLTGNFWWAIVVFTFLSKIVLLPVAVMVQKNSIKMVKMYPEMNRIKARYFGNRDMISEEQYKLYKRDNYHPAFDLIPVALQLVILLGVTAAFPPSDEKNPVWMAVLAALSALVMCICQNRSNVLQSQQGKANKYGTLAFSVALSLYLGLFVSKGVAFYWVCSNLMATVQMYILNFCINPKKYIDYEALEQSRIELARVEKQASSAKKKRSKELVKRENSDYRRFLKFENKQIVFYSEKNGFYKYFKDVIETLLRKTDIIIHYISSDPDDAVFAMESEYFRTYYIDEKLMILMMRMEADMVVMTTPDLQNYYIKRSMVKDDIEYLFMDHAMNSMNLTYHKGALDHFDTVFVPNGLNYAEIRGQERAYGLKEKNLVKYGYALIDNMAKAYESGERPVKARPRILIAPSWQEDNIMDLCIEPMLDGLLDGDFDVTVRPHPQYVRHFPEKLDDLGRKYSSRSNFTLETDFSSNSTVYEADVLVTDWSGIAYEYSFSTLKPCLFINTPMKIINPDYTDIDVVPSDISIRNKIGISLDPCDLSGIKDAAEKLLSSEDFSADSLRSLRDEYLYNFGNAANVGANYIIRSLIEKSRQN